MSNEHRTTSSELQDVLLHFFKEEVERFDLEDGLAAAAQTLDSYKWKAIESVQTHELQGND